MQVALAAGMDHHIIQMIHNIFHDFQTVVVIDTVTIVLLLIIFADNKKRHKSQKDYTKMTEL